MHRLQHERKVKEPTWTARSGTNKWITERHIMSSWHNIDKENRGEISHWEREKKKKIKLTFMKFMLFIQWSLFSLKWFFFHRTGNARMEPTNIPFSALAGSAPRTAPCLSHPRLYMMMINKTGEQRSAPPHLYIPTHPARSAFTKCCCSPHEPIKTLSLSRANKPSSSCRDYSHSKLSRDSLLRLRRRYHSLIFI